MNTTNYYAVVLFALAINIGLSSDSLMAQQGYSGHSGSCAGGCNHGSDGSDSLELIPYGQSGQQALRQGYPSRQMPPSYGPREAVGGGMNFPQNYQSRPPYRAAYQGSFGSPNNRGGRENYQMRREEFTYANDPANGLSSRGHRGNGSCRGGGCSHGHRENGGSDSRGYEGEGQPAYGGSGQYIDEADRAPRLNMYPPRRDNLSASYGRSRSSQSNNPRSFQMRQDYVNSRLQGGVGATSDEVYSPLGPPPTSLGLPSASGSSSCGQAGCNHDHN